jgi:hypothetical protein
LRDIESHFDISIIWLEYTGKKSYKVVDFDSASREGAPFKQAIIDNSWYLPNQMQRSCTIKMKNQTMSYYLKDQGIIEAQNWVGIRADEPKRFKMEGVTLTNQQYANGDFKPLNKIIKEEKVLPLRWGRVNKADVLDYWRSMPFDLELGPNESNCDLCFMKGADNIISEITREPGLADFWIECEEMVSKHHGKPVTFRPDRPDYKTMKIIATTQQDMFFGDTDNLPCSCTD